MRRKVIQVLDIQAIDLLSIAEESWSRAICHSVRSASDFSAGGNAAALSPERLEAGRREPWKTDWTRTRTE